MIVSDGTKIFTDEFVKEGITGCADSGDVLIVLAVVSKDGIRHIDCVTGEDSYRGCSPTDLWQRYLLPATMALRQEEGR